MNAQLTPTGLTVAQRRESELRPLPPGQPSCAAAALTTRPPAAPVPGAPVSDGLPSLPWRDPSAVPPEELAAYIQLLEQACLEQPRSAGLRTCLGMAHAMNYDVYRSLDALECAVQLDNQHFFAQMKYAELLYRLRAMNRAEQETQKALNLAGNTWELSLARRQLQEIRRLKREGLMRPDWKGSLRMPALVFTIVCALLFVLRMVR